jgi:hypothetical protein
MLNESLDAAEPEAGQEGVAPWQSPLSAANAYSSAATGAGLGAALNAYI